MAISIAQTAGPANLVEWAKLALRHPQAPVLRATRIQHDDRQRPLTLEEVVLPLDRFPSLSSDDDVIPDIIALARRYSLSLGAATERISIVPASKDIALHLGVAAGTDMVKVERITETADGEPVEWRVAYTRTTP